VNKMITFDTPINLIIGNPLDHSKTPLLHNTIYQDFDLKFVCLAAPKLEPADVLKTMVSMSINLVAVTMPYKDYFIEKLDSVCDVSQKCCSMNTIIQKEGKFLGYNTDYFGIAHTFRNTNIKNKNVLILGAGGAARTAAHYLKEQGAHLFYLGRNEKKRDHIAQQFAGTVLGEINKDTPKNIHFDIIINTTPLGMGAYRELSPLEDFHFSANQIVFDMIYNPVQTKLLSQAEQAGAQIFSGLDMFIVQAIKQVEILCGKNLYTEDYFSKYRNLILGAI
jgi:shikimate dehydrogenase